jgi:hypothetical protein
MRSYRLMVLLFILVAAGVAAGISGANAWEMYSIGIASGAMVSGGCAEILIDLHQAPPGPSLDMRGRRPR